MPSSSRPCSASCSPISPSSGRCRPRRAASASTARRSRPSVATGDLGAAAAACSPSAAGASRCSSSTRSGTTSAAPGHETRSFRLSHSDADDVRLAVRALELWNDLERRGGETLLRRNGLLQRGSVVPPMAAALREAGVRYDELDHRDVSRLFPEMRPQPDAPAIFQPDGAVILARRSIVLQVRLACRGRRRRARGREVHRARAAGRRRPRLHPPPPHRRRHRRRLRRAVVAAAARPARPAPAAAGRPRPGHVVPQPVPRLGAAPGPDGAHAGPGVYGMPEFGRGYKLGWATINPMTFWKASKVRPYDRENEQALVERVREDFPGFDPTPLRHEAGPDHARARRAVRDRPARADRRRRRLHRPRLQVLARARRAVRRPRRGAAPAARGAALRPRPPDARTRAPAADASPSAPDRTPPRARGIQSALSRKEGAWRSGGRRAARQGESLPPDVVAQVGRLHGAGLLRHLLHSGDRRTRVRRQGRGHRHPVRDPAHGHRHARAGLDHLALRQAHPRGGRALRLRRRGLRQARRPVRRVGLLRRRDDAHAGDRPRLRRLRQPDPAGRPRRPHQLDLVHAGVLDRGLGDLGAGSADLHARAAHPGARLGGHRVRLGGLRGPQGRQRRLLDCARSTPASRPSRASPTASSTPGSYSWASNRRRTWPRRRPSRSATSRAPSSTACWRPDSSTSCSRGRSSWPSASTSPSCSRTSRRSMSRLPTPTSAATGSRSSCSGWW